MKIKYLKKMQEELERENSYFQKIINSNRRFEELLRKSLGKELGQKIIEDVDFQDNVLAYASNGEVQPIEVFEMYLKQAIKRLN